jgi:hypothetical protein
MHILEGPDKRCGHDPEGNESKLPSGNGVRALGMENAVTKQDMQTG